MFFILGCLVDRYCPRLFELVACVGDVRCARVLVAFIRVKFNSMQSSVVARDVEMQMEHQKAAASQPCASHTPAGSAAHVALDMPGHAGEPALIEVNRLSSVLSHTTALHICCARGHAELLLYLMEELASCNKGDMLFHARPYLSWLPGLKLPPDVWGSWRPLDYLFAFDRDDILQQVIAHFKYDSDSSCTGQAAVSGGQSKWILQISQDFLVEFLLDRSMFLGAIK